jgi:hypothetical protein
VIAQTAQSFGQDDDITVLTVTLEASALAPEALLGLPRSALTAKSPLKSSP